MTVSAQESDHETKKILVLGDSLSGSYGISIQQGWVSLLQQQIDRDGYRYKVVNTSISGDTTRSGLARIDFALKTHQPSIVIIALGGNDGLRGLPFSEIEDSLSLIIQRCLDREAQPLLVAVRMPSNYGQQYNQMFADVFERLSVNYGIPRVPKFLDQVGENLELMQDDGIHPTAKAQPQIMKNIYQSLKLML